MAMAVDIVFDLHGRALRSMCSRLDHHFQGLHAATKVARRRRLMTPATAKKLSHLEMCYHVLLHVTEPYARDLLDTIQFEMRGVDDGLEITGAEYSMGSGDAAPSVSGAASQTPLAKSARFAMVLVWPVAHEGSAAAQGSIADFGIQAPGCFCIGDSGSCASHEACVDPYAVAAAQGLAHDTGFGDDTAGAEQCGMTAEFKQGALSWQAGPSDDENAYRDNGTNTASEEQHNDSNTGSAVDCEGGVSMDDLWFKLLVADHAEFLEWMGSRGGG